MANYIDNKRFEDLIRLYKSGDKECENELFDNFSTLIDHLLGAYRFNIDYDEAKQECYLLILKVLKNFNKEHGKAFNYFTTVILNNFRLLYTKNKKYSEKLESYKEVRLGVYSSPSSAPIDPL